MTESSDDDGTKRELRRATKSSDDTRSNNARMTPHAISLLLPTAANMTVVPILSLLLSGILTRTDNPDAAIGGFSVALGISMFVGLPQLRTQQLTLVFFDNHASLKQLRKFVVFWVAIVTIIALIVVIPSITEFLLTSVFSVTGELKQNAQEALL